MVNGKSVMQFESTPIATDASCGFSLNNARGMKSVGPSHWKCLLTTYGRASDSGKNESMRIPSLLKYLRTVSVCEALRRSARVAAESREIGKTAKPVGSEHPSSLAR